MGSLLGESSGPRLAAAGRLHRGARRGAAVENGGVDAQGLLERRRRFLRSPGGLRAPERGPRGPARPGAPGARPARARPWPRPARRGRRAASGPRRCHAAALVGSRRTPSRRSSASSSHFSSATRCFASFSRTGPRRSGPIPSARAARQAATPSSRFFRSHRRACSRAAGVSPRAAGGSRSPRRRRSWRARGRARRRATSRGLPRPSLSPGADESSTADGPFGSSRRCPPASPQCHNRSGPAAARAAGRSFHVHRFRDAACRVDQARRTSPRRSRAEDLARFEAVDLFYRSLCALLYNYVPMSGHPGGSISSGRFVAGLLFDAMDYELAKPDREDADIVSYAAGHKAMGLYSMWALRDELARVGNPALLPGGRGRPAAPRGPARLPPQPDHRDAALPQASAPRPSTGTRRRRRRSSGSRPAPPASASRARSASPSPRASTTATKAPRVHIVEGEGGLTPGRVAEALAAAGTASLDNVVVHVDWNQASIDSNRVCREDGAPGDYVQWTPAELFYLHDWNVIEVPDGRDFQQVIAAQRLAASMATGQPTADRVPHGEGLAVRDRGPRLARRRPQAVLRRLLPGARRALGPHLLRAAQLRGLGPPLRDGPGRPDRHGAVLLRRAPAPAQGGRGRPCHGGGHGGAARRGARDGSTPPAARPGQAPRASRPCTSWPAAGRRSRPSWR